METPQLIASVWKTPNGTILQSKHRHDFCHVEEDGVIYFIDGGTDYCRMSAGLTSMCVYEDSPFTVQRQWFTWGSYGKNGDEPRKDLRLMDMETEHIMAILRTQKHIYGTYVDALFTKELIYREILSTVHETPLDDVITMIWRLEKRAQIRRNASDRKSVQEGAPDRISDQLEEAAHMFKSLAKAHLV